MVKTKAAPAPGGMPSTIPAAPNAVPLGGAASVNPNAKPKKEKAPKVKSKKRSDFPDPKTGWVDWCEYKKTRIAAKVVKLNEDIASWERRKAGEETAKSEKKIKKVMNMTKKVTASLLELIASGVDLKSLGIDEAQLKALGVTLPSKS
jgi:hypothetical protein